MFTGTRLTYLIVFTFLDLWYVTIFWIRSPTENENFHFILRKEQGFISGLRSRNYFFPLRLRLSTSFRSGSSSGAGSGSRLELWGCLFSQLLNEEVDFSWFFGKNIDFWSYSIWVMIKYTTLVCPGAGAETSVYRLQLRLRLQPKVSAPAGSGSATLFYIIDFFYWLMIEPVLRIRIR